MCQNAFFIKNKYTGQKILCNCGRCPSCLEQKAMRMTSRLNNSVRDGEIGLFVTLTYRNWFIPYVRRDDVENCVYPLPVYRDFNHRWYYSRRDRRLKAKITKSPFVINVLDDVDYSHDYHLKLNGIKHNNNHISVNNYADVQNFFKRLRINLQRKFGYDIPLRSYQCSELGPSTWRSHFHLLIYVPAVYENVVRTAIVKSWPFADYSRTKNNIFVDTGAKHYVSAYVNRPTNFPRFHEASSIRPKNSSSPSLGLDNSAFSLASLLSCADRNDMRYRRQIFIHGVPDVALVKIPKYVINRFFPLFKGFSRLPCSPHGFNLHDFIRNPFNARYAFGELVGNRFKSFDSSFSDYVLNGILRHGYSPRILAHLSLCGTHIISLSDYLNYSFDDLRSIQLRLRNAAVRAGYVNFDGSVNWYNYSHDYEKVHLACAMTNLKMFYEQLEKLGSWQMYDNLEDLRKSHYLAPTLLASFVLENPSTDFNDMIERRMMTSFYSSMYHQNVKKRKMTNYSMAVQGHDV